MTGASCGSIPNFADAMHLHDASMSLVLPLVDAHLASGRASITLPARRCKAGLRWWFGDREGRRGGPDDGLEEPDRQIWVPSSHLLVARSDCAVIVLAAHGRGGAAGLLRRTQGRRPTRRALICHSRVAAAASYEASFEGCGRLLAKYLPLTPSTSGDDAR